MNLANLTLYELTAGYKNRADSRVGQTSGVKTGVTTLRRCRTREHGEALLSISHAIEYLLDSQLLKPGSASNAEREALAILLTANLAVYREGAEIVSISDRFRQWFRGGARAKKISDATA